MDDLTPQEKFMVEEIRLNRAEIGKVRDAVSGKVGRGELFGWLSAIVGIVTLLFATGA